MLFGVLEHGWVSVHHIDQLKIILRTFNPPPPWWWFFTVRLIVKVSPVAYRLETGFESCKPTRPWVTESKQHNKKMICSMDLPLFDQTTKREGGKERAKNSVVVANETFDDCRSLSWSRSSADKRSISDLFGHTCIDLIWQSGFV